MITEHYPTDVPRLTRIVDPPEHKGKLIVDVKLSLKKDYVTIICDDGTQFDRRNHLTIRVEHGPERQAKVAWAKGIIDGC